MDYENRIKILEWQIKIVAWCCFGLLVIAIFR